MFTITTSLVSNPTTGRASIVAKGHGKQRTVPMDYSRTTEAKHALAVGALLNVLCDDRQKAMLRHPSGGQRVRHEVTSVNGKTRDRWSIDV